MAERGGIKVQVVIERTLKEISNGNFVLDMKNKCGVGGIEVMFLEDRATED